MESVWHNSVELPHFQPLLEDKKTDVLIIGGGMAGIMTAFFLHRLGVDYILVEKDEICGETTGNTTAKITVQHGLIYHKILKNYGVEYASKYLNANNTALLKYYELCKTIDCEFEISDNYVYTVDDRYTLEEEMNALQKIGFNAALCEKPSIPLKTAGAVKFPNQAHFHPLKFIKSICNDLNIHENTFVYEMTNNTAKTKNGSIKAQNIVVATHFPFINKHGFYPLKLYQHRSYVIALENAMDINGMYVDESDTGMSFRNYGNMLLLGGGGHRTGKKGGNWNEIRKFANKQLPNAVEKYHWSAQDCMSIDSIPYIGLYSKSTPNLYVASGFNKWGMTGAMVSAMLICDALMGKKNEFADVFDPSRNFLKPQLLVNTFESVKNLLTISRKRCPHLGCALKWNSIEHSWDCPCHGSRFTKTGRVINNPANCNMK